jgi:hypothetical protein
MRHLAFALAVPLALTHAAAAEPAFSPAALRAHVEFLADDLLEGREAGSRGYDIAARYVATQLGALGLTPPVNGGWYQRVPLVRSRLAASSPPTLAIGDRTFTHKQGVLVAPSLVEATQRYEGSLVFGGYCIAGEGGDDYAGLDVKGKVVLCLSGFPKGMKSDIGAHLNSRKRLMAQERGAIGLFSFQTKQSAKAFPFARMLEDADQPASAWAQADGTASARRRARTWARSSIPRPRGRPSPDRRARSRTSSPRPTSPAAGRRASRSRRRSGTRARASSRATRAPTCSASSPAPIRASRTRSSC